MTFEVVDGTFKPTGTDKPRHIVGARAVLTVELAASGGPPAKTACFAQTGLKFPVGGDGKTCGVRPRRMVMFCGEVDGVRCYVHEREGKTHVILTRRELKP